MFDIHTKNLIKKNTVYIILFCLFSGLIFYLVDFQVKDYLDYKTKVSDLKNEVQNLEKEKTIIYSFDVGQINNLVSTLNTLLPSQEDYFSIIKTLETLSQETNFQITSYNVSFQNNTNDKVSLEINGEGSPDSLLAFLQSYQLNGGRLITMNNIQFSPSTTKAVFVLNFYSKDVKVNDTSAPVSLNPEMLNKLQQLNSNLNNINQTPVSGINTNYQTKPNPFTF